ncbi:LytR/AlgR family response regulator transcription factor [Pedobacter metabolipauper]|uniref:LytTR family two component transcriptional regulator n=1 Tax=Pedobacter metabolipauper TaxID=425513 RepID=A0A4R6T050_9SPHI|nr:LytTR family DNA-binding domain-containing protein [Pedobacter metabolipauper]TDQ11762.1 LytTR family two component transcriptional regulator [Pedobacter metabolipauper]
MGFKCVIIDDEQYAIDALVNYINQIPDLDLLKTFTNPTEALSSIRTEDQIDFIFIDIEMPDISGLELAQHLRSKTRFLIFTTSHSSHAITAFDLNASHYLLKPISFSKFALTIADLIKDKETIILPQKKEKHLCFIKADHKNTYNYIDFEDIVYVEAAKNYVIIYTSNEKERYMTHMGLNHVEAALNSSFIRINKSFIIAKNAIKKVEGHNIKLKNGKDLQLGDVYKPAFQLFLNDSILKP